MIKKEQKKRKVKLSQKKFSVNIPPFGEIPLGSVPSSGGTASAEKLSEEFKKAAENRIFPPPEEYGYPESNR